VAAVTYYQPAPAGVWRSSPQRMILWAIEQVIAKQRDIGEASTIETWEGKLERAYSKPVKDFDWQAYFAELRKADDPDVPADVVAGWATVEDMIPALWIEAAEMRTSMLGLPFDPAALDEAVGEVGDLVKSLPENAAERLRSILRSVYAEEGVSQFEFARRIKSEWANVSTVKARQIAVTEWNRAASGATLHQYKASGIGTKLWITVGDDRVCPECDTNAASGEIPIHEAFPFGGDCPPQHTSCRCSIAGGYG
jgi:SPP1 gp7 family putative phage head morphogenesis protein